MFTIELQKKLHNDGFNEITVNCLCPGFVNTEISFLNRSLSILVKLV